MARVGEHSAYSFKLPRFQPSNALSPVRAAIQLTDGVRESAPPNPARSVAVLPSERGDGRRYDIEVPLFEEPWLGVTYELPLGDLATPLRASLLVLLYICVTLIPFGLVAMSGLIPSVGWRIGAALGVWGVAELASPFLPAKFMDPINRVAVPVAGLAGLMAIILFLASSVRRQGGPALEALPDNLPLVPSIELRKLRRRFQDQLAHEQNQRQDGGLPIGRAGDRVQQLKERMRTIDEMLAQRVSVATDWSLEALRELLTAAFSDEELIVLCHDHFHAVFADFGSGFSKGERIQALLDFCVRHRELDKLVSQVQEANLAQYRAFEAQLKP